jgi:hypothetical protein
MLLRCWIFAGFAIAAPAQTFTTLVSFNGVNGFLPYGALVQGADGSFYGTTRLGGIFGTVFDATFWETLYRAMLSAAIPQPR